MKKTYNLSRAIFSGILIFIIFLIFVFVLLGINQIYLVFLIPFIVVAIIFTIVDVKIEIEKKDKKSGGRKNLKGNEI